VTVPARSPLDDALDRLESALPLAHMGGDPAQQAWVLDKREALDTVREALEQLREGLREIATMPVASGPGVRMRQIARNTLDALLSASPTDGGGA
jgi:hypothetical protein